MAGAGAREGDGLVLVGRIGAAHGVRGEVRLAAFTGDPMAIAGYGPLLTRKGERVTIVSARAHKGGLVVRLEGVADRNAAEALNGTELYLSRQSLPPPEDEDDFYHADLIGLIARDGAGAVLGEVIAMHDFGAGDLIEIRAPSGRTALYPFTREVVPDIDISKGYLVLMPPPETSAEDGE